MHRYEPQALRLLADGRLADRRGGRQGLARQSPGAVRHPGGDGAPPAPPSRADLDRTTWAPLNRPLHAWPEPQWLASSDAVDDFPVGPLPADLAAYDTVVSARAQRDTVSKIDADRPQRPDDLRRLPPLLGARRRRRRGRLRRRRRSDAGRALGRHLLVRRLDGLPQHHRARRRSGRCARATSSGSTSSPSPAPCAPCTPRSCSAARPRGWFYCGQAPTGYGAYRTDFNSSHAYFENLFLYYWLTGDSDGGRHRAAGRRQHAPLGVPGRAAPAGG